jgi:two-component system, response regulator
MNAPGIRIMIIEAAARAEQSAAAMLQQNNLSNNLVRFADGNKALDYLFRAGAYASQKDKEQPRLILLDMEIPASPGLEVVRQIKSDHRTRAIPLAVMVSPGKEQVLQKCIALGVSDHMLKPPVFSDFAQVMVRLGFHWVLHAPQARTGN